MSDRFGAVTYKGKALHVRGTVLTAGDQAPNFRLHGNDWQFVTLADSARKVRLISVVPSLDTGICDAQTKHFNEAANALGDEVVVLTVSADLPWAQRRWCGLNGVENVLTLSDHQDMSFGNAYGTHIVEMRVEQRAIFVVDQENVIRYVEYVPEIAQFPDYDAALDAVRQLLTAAPETV